MKRTLGAVGTAIASLCACGAPADPAAHTSSADTPATTSPTPALKGPAPATHRDLEPAPGFEPPYAEAELQALRARWQGAWVIRSGELGQQEAWLVQGDEVTISDGKSERHYRFEVVAPCKGGLTSEGALGNTTHYFNFAFDGDQLYAGTSRAGVKRGDDIVACTLSGIYTHVAGRCFHWEQHPLREQEWKQTALDCSVRDEGGQQDFVADDPAFGPQQFRIAAGLLVHPTLERDPYLAQRAADIKAARQALSAG